MIIPTISILFFNDTATDSIPSSKGLGTFSTYTTGQSHSVFFSTSKPMY